MRLARGDKLEILLRTRRIEVMNPNLARHIISQAKSLRQIPKKLFIRPRKRVEAFKR